MSSNRRRRRRRRDYRGILPPLTGFAFMAFVLIYVPCVATIGVIATAENERGKLFLFIRL
ncbi:MAG: hypothetical protein WAV32_09865 [Halobacteriota archaeon]